MMGIEREAGRKEDKIRVRISGAMFHTPLNEISFEKVENFCRAFPEGVRVEYKRELTKDIPKVISSFANISVS